MIDRRLKVKVAVALGVTAAFIAWLFGHDSAATFIGLATNHLWIWED
jgi:hypothetical protein